MCSAELELPSWEGCFQVARSIVRELGLDYYEKDDRLTLIESLHLILPKVMYGNGMPETISKSPWKVDTKQPKHKLINNLLDYSMKVQMGHIPGTEFTDFILSNACLAVCNLITLYLEALQVKSEVVVGILQFSQKPDSDGTPHLWLEVEGELIDNTFVYIPPERGPADLFFKMKAEILYSKEDLEKTKRKLFFADEVSPHSLKIFKAYSKRENLEKYLVSCFRTVQVNPCIKMYDIVMRDYLHRVHGVALPNLEDKWSTRCWACGKMAEPVNSPNPKKLASVSLKSCSTCKMAKYCGPNCQKLDWKAHKLLHYGIEHATTLRATMTTASSTEPEGADDSTEVPVATAEPATIEEITD